MRDGPGCHPRNLLSTNASTVRIGEKLQDEWLTVWRLPEYCTNSDTSSYFSSHNKSFKRLTERDPHVPVVQTGDIPTCRKYLQIEDPQL